MATIECNNEQLQIIKMALDLYSRVGMVQLERILDHPTIDRAIEDNYTPQKQIEVGDDCLQGKVVKITKKYVWTKGSWGKGEEVRRFKREEVRLSPDWEGVHKMRDDIRRLAGLMKNLISKGKLSANGNYGIHNEKVDESCRVCWDVLQVIRHEFWKQSLDKDSWSLESHVYHASDTKNVKVKLDESV